MHNQLIKTIKYLLNKETKNSRKYIHKKWPGNILEQIKEYTNFLPEDFTIIQRIYHILYGLNIKGKCIICGNNTPFISLELGYQEHCSRNCMYKNKKIREKAKQTCLKKYGVDNPSKLKEIQNKKEQTCLKNYGVKYPGQSEIVKKQSRQNSLEKYGVDSPNKLKEIKEKKKKICLEKYGVDNVFKSEKIKEKIKETNIKKYGVVNPSKSNIIKLKKEKTSLKNYGVKYPAQSKIIKEQIKLTYLKKYGVSHPEYSEEFKRKKFDSFYDKLLISNRLSNKVKPLFDKKDYCGIHNFYFFECKKCGNKFKDHLKYGKVPRCLKCYPIDPLYSLLEKEIVDELLKLKIEKICENDRKIIFPSELDIYLPDYNLAIEFNGIYHHSEISGNKNSNYHLQKTKKCIEKGIQLIHIFEDEWMEKEEIVKSIIKNKLGMIENRIYARNCEIKEISNEDYELFLIDNHIQGYVPAKYKIGLYYNKELIQLCSFSKPRFQNDNYYDFELIRSCSKINTSVIGGFNKLIKCFIKKYKVNKLISYVDRRYFNGKGYKNWKLIKITHPNYYYTKNYQIRESRIKYQKHKLQKLFPEHYDSILTEWEIMQLAEYDRIWDCGNLMFVKNKK